jgi:hypothetical protein
MSRVTFEAEPEILLDNLDESTPIFAKREGKLAGMVVKQDQEWILRTGGNLGANGYHSSRKACLEDGVRLGFKFYVEHV